MAMIHHKPMSRQIIHLPRCFWHEAPPADPREQAVAVPSHAPVVEVSPLGRLHLAEADMPRVLDLVRARQAQRQERERALAYFDDKQRAKYQRAWAEEQAREIEAWTAKLAEAISQMRYGCPVACLPQTVKDALETGTRQLVQLLDEVQE